MTPKPYSSATASSRPNTSGTTTKASTCAAKWWCCLPASRRRDDPKFFNGEALTYYGRWTYKYEEAARHGAVGAIIIHTTPTASYGWNVVRSSWSKEELAVKLAPGAPRLGFAGWVTNEAGERIAAALGKTADRAARRWPIPAASARSRCRCVSAFARRRRSARSRTRNVIGKVEGSDPQLKNEAVMFSAHWDHLGVGEAIRGDAIYNGAQDNATGCGMLLELARAWAALPQKPRRSALFISVAAEEAGLLGSRILRPAPRGSRRQNRAGHQLR